MFLYSVGQSDFLVTPDQGCQWSYKSFDFLAFRYRNETFRVRLLKLRPSKDKTLPSEFRNAIFSVFLRKNERKNFPFFREQIEYEKDRQLF